MALSIALLRPGETGIIEKTDNRAGLSRRFFEIGLIEKARVRIYALSPLKDPLAISVMGSVYAVRAADLRGVTVRREARA